MRKNKDSERQLCGPALVLLVVMLLAGRVGLWAQTATGAIDGTITDPSGAAIVGAQVTVTNQGTNIQSTGRSNESGFYAFRNLPPGRYTLKVESQGFKGAETPAFPLEVNQTVTKDMSLTVGSVTESVEVVAGSEMIQQASSELGEVVSQKAVADLPLNGRNFTQLMTLTPGATPISTAQGNSLGTGDGSNTGVPGSTFVQPSFNGQENRSYVIYQDGIINFDFRSQGYATIPNVDLLEEFKVQSHNDKVEWGGATGGIVNLVTKSGTNDYHGSAFWSVRNNVFDARDPFSDAHSSGPPPFRQNQFGGAFTGRIIRNKTFFSGGYEGWRYRSPTQSRSRVPTDAELSGDFSSSIIGHNIYDPFSTTQDAAGNYHRTQFPGNQIPASLISPAMQGFLRQYSEAPNYVDPLFNFINSVSAQDNADSFQIKIDHQFSDKDSVFGRFSYLSRDATTPNGQKSSSGSTTDAKNWGGGWIHVFSPSLFLSVRGGVARRDIVAFNNYKAGLDPLKQLGLQQIDTFQGFEASLTSPWGTVGPTGPAPRQNPTFNIAGDITKMIGNHSLKFGGQWLAVERLQNNTAQQWFFADSTTGDPQQPGVTGASLASALLGLPSSYNGYLPKQALINFRISTFSGYAQDEWKVSPRLTLNYGIRLDHALPVHMLTSNGFLSTFDLQKQQWLIGLTSMPPACSQAGQAPCIPDNVPYSNQIALTKPNFFPTNEWDNWGPRFGAAYRVNDKTVVRAGYGLYFDALNSISQYTQNNLNGWPATTGFNGVANAVGQPLQLITALQGSITPGLPAPSPWNQNGIWVNAPNFKDQYSHQWNVEIQRQMTGDLMASVAYVGSVNRRGDYTGLGNSATTPGPGTPDQVNAKRPMPIAGGGIFYSESIGDSSYNALQVKVRKRFSNGLQTLISYTWSKTLSNGSSGWFSAENGVGGDASIQDFFNPSSNRGVTAYDIPQFLSWYTVYELPFGVGKPYLSTGPAARILGNWQINNILQWRSGAPYNLEVPGDVANIGNSVAWWNYARPNLVGNPRVSNPTVGEYYNPSAFAVPNFSYGDFGNNVLRSDRVSNMDLSLFKDFHITETKLINLRFEAFNVFNHIDWAAPGTLISQPGAGQVTSSAHPPRVLQMGLKFLF